MAAADEGEAAEEAESEGNAEVDLISTVAAFEGGGGGGADGLILQEELREGIGGNAFVVVWFVAVFILYCFVFDSVQNDGWLTLSFQLFTGADGVTNMGRTIPCA